MHFAGISNAAKYACSIGIHSAKKRFAFSGVLWREMRSLLQFRGDVQKYGKIVIRRKVGVHGVCPLGNNELFRRGLHGALQLHGSAVEPPVKNLFAAPEREQHLGEKPFPIHIPAGLGQTARRCAAQSGEKSRPYETRCNHTVRREFCRASFCRSRSRPQWRDARGFSGEPPVKLREQRGETVGLDLFRSYRSSMGKPSASAAGIS